MSEAALEEGKCVVIGLQSTGEARTADVVAERGEILDDYVSGPRVSHRASLPMSLHSIHIHPCTAWFNFLIRLHTSLGSIVSVFEHLVSCAQPFKESAVSHTRKLHSITE